MKVIDHYYSYRTYSGCLEGVPSVESVYSGIKLKAKAMWGVRATHIIEPALKKIRANMAHHIEEIEMLPEWTHIAWVNGPEKDPENHGSELVLIWFSDDPSFNVNDIVESVDWSAHAEDFQY